jgi:hypothetical protein
MLFVGLQLVIWSITGAYMVLMDIHYIHGDTLVAKKTQSLTPNQVQYTFKELLAAHPKAKAVELGSMLNQAVYRFNIDKKKELVSAFDGKQLSPINEKLATAIARDKYHNKEVAIAKVQLLTEHGPRELSTRHLPVWRVDFDEFSSPSFYISANSGQLVTKRHNFWRLFDWIFAFHVMDYIDGEADNKLLFFFSIMALIASAFGLVLTYYRLAPNYLHPKKLTSSYKVKRHNSKDDKAEQANEDS